MPQGSHLREKRSLEKWDCLQKNKCHLVPADFLQRSVGLFRACVNNLMENSRREAAHVILTLPASRQDIKCFPSQQSVVGSQDASNINNPEKDDFALGRGWWAGGISPERSFLLLPLGSWSETPGYGTSETAKPGSRLSQMHPATASRCRAAEVGWERRGTQAVC